MVWNNKSVLHFLRAEGKVDPIQAIKEKARELVVMGFNQGWDGPPFNPIKLANLLGISVLPNEAIFDARILLDAKETQIIEYNPFQKETRINYSIAHEIGHTFFPDCNEVTRNRESENNNDNWELEFLCNIAAAELLLPYAEFTTEANSLVPTLENLLGIANKYKASVESVFLRFCEVVDKPCTIILAHFVDNTLKSLAIEYIKSSRSASLHEDEIKDIPQDSCVFECLNPGWTATAIERWNVFGVTRYAVYGIGLPPIKRQNHSRVGILLVPEFYAENTMSKITYVNGDATKPRGSGNKIIVQIVNTSGGLGFGFGRAMSKNWPKSKVAILDWMKNSSEFKLGHYRTTQLDEDVYVFQAIAQKGIFPKNGEIPLRYDSLRTCIKSLANTSKQLNASVHMPRIGSGQAKGDWNIIEGMIYDELINEGINVKVYILPGSEITKQNRSQNLSLF